MKTPSQKVAILGYGCVLGRWCVWIHYGQDKGLVSGGRAIRYQEELRFQCCLYKRISCGWDEDAIDLRSMVKLIPGVTFTDDAVTGSVNTTSRIAEGLKDARTSGTTLARENAAVTFESVGFD